MYSISKILDKHSLETIYNIFFRTLASFLTLFDTDGCCIAYFELSSPENSDRPSVSLNRKDLNNASECKEYRFKLPTEITQKGTSSILKCTCGIKVHVSPIKHKQRIIGFIGVGIPNTEKLQNDDMHDLSSDELTKLTKQQIKEVSKFIKHLYENSIINDIIPSSLCNSDNSSYHNIVNNNPSCVITFKQSGNDLKVSYANKNYLARKSLKSLAQITGKNINDVICDLGELYDRHISVINTGKPEKLRRYMHINKDSGESSCWDISIAPLVKDGKIAGTISINNEILVHTISKKDYDKLSHALTEKTAHLEALIDNMSEGLLLGSKSGDYILGNKSASELLHIDKKIKNVKATKEFFLLKGIDGKPIALDDYPLQKVSRGEKLKDALYTAEISGSSEKRILLFNGQPIYDKENNFQFCLITFNDITTMQEQRRTLEENWIFINGALDHMEAPVFALTYPELKVVLVNKQTSSILSTLLEKPLEKDHILYLKLKEILKNTKYADFGQYFIDVGKGKTTITSSTKIPIVINGETRYFTTVCTPILNGRGKTTHIICSAFDITSSINYSKKLEEISSMKEEFFANISHEFRTPLTVILGALQMINSQNRNFSEGRERRVSAKYVSIIKQNCNRLIRLINNLLDVTRIDSGYLVLYLQNHDIVALVKEITLSVSEYVAQKDISLSFSSNVEKKKMAVDLDKIERIILNLLSNAAKFTPPGNKISVSLIDKDNFVEIHVKDTGIGIPPEKLDIIFERFRQADNVLTQKSEGSGIGLSLVKSLVEMHGGMISVKSKVGRGSEFIVNIPCSPTKEYIEVVGKSNCNHSINGSIDIEFSDVKLK